MPAHGQTLPPGPQVLTFFSDLDDTEQPYTIYIPPGYSEEKQYPLVVMLHGAGSNHRLALRRVFGKSNAGDETDVEASRYFPEWKDIDMIVVAPYARGTAGYTGFVEKDVLDMITDVKQRFSIDENRMYLTGLSMGGGGTLWIGLRHPDMWAAIAPVCPSPPGGAEALAPNATNMAVQFVHGDADPTVPVSISREWVASLKTIGISALEYRELPGVDHWSWVQAYEYGRIFDWFSKFTRNPHPDRVWHVSYDLEHGKAYWVRMKAIVPGSVASIDARFVALNHLEIKTQNLSAFTLTLIGHPKYSNTLRLSVMIDSVMRSVDPGGVYTFKKIQDSDSRKERWLQDIQTSVGKVNPALKKAGLEGPIADAFASRHLYVYGTADSPTPEALQARRDTALKAANWSIYRGEFLGRIRFYPRVISDVELRESDYESGHLILFGTKETNHAIARFQDDLPLHLPDEKVKDHGLVYIYPNRHGRYVVINSGLPWWHAREITGWRFLPEVHTHLTTLPDVVFFRHGKLVIAEGYFDEMWRVPPAISDALR